MPHHRTVRHRLAPVGAVTAVLLAGALPAGASPAAPTPVPSPTFGVSRTPCPGTLVPLPPAPPTTPGRPTPGRPVPARTSPTATPSPTPTQHYPAPAIATSPHPVGGERLGTAGLVTDLPAGVPAPPQLDATAYVLADQGTGQILVARAPHARLYPASTLKTLTALTIMGDLDPHRVVTASAGDQDAEGTRAGMVAGNPYRTDQLWGAVLMLSANDAAYALARSAPGGVSQTLRRMNATAASLGAHDTVAVDPSGLDAQGQRSSAYDLAVIGRAAMQRPDFRRYVTQREVMFPGAKQADGRVVPPYPIQNLDRFFLHYPGATGVKTGYTTGAHRTYIQTASRGGRSYLLTVMCSDTVDWKAMGTMMDWAFRYAPRARPVGTLGDAATSTSATTPATTAPTGAGAAASADAQPRSTAGAPAAQPTGPSGRSRQAWWWVAGALAVALLGGGAIMVRRRH